MSLTDAAFAKSEPQIKDEEVSIFRAHSPHKRSIFAHLENLLPSSPDVVLSVPETPNSQIRLSSSTNLGQISPQVSKDVESPGKMSPIRRSPRSKGPCVRRLMTEVGLRAKKEGGSSGSLKRLYSPPEESQNAKRTRSAYPLAQRTESPIVSDIKVTNPVIGPVKKLHISNDQSERSEGQTFGLSSLREQVQRQEERDKDERDSGFTVISEQKATEGKATYNEGHTQSLTVHTHKPSAQAVTPALQRSPKEEVEGAAITAVISSDGDGGNVTSSDQDLAGGTVDEAWL